MKIYASVVTIIVVILLGYQTILYIADKNNYAKEIAVFDNIKNQHNIFKLNYRKNGDLIFSSVKLQPSIPSITHWDYYGSTEIINYKWENQNTIIIEMKDSILKIVIPEFTVTAK